MKAKLPAKRDIRFLLAEDVRPETNGKFTIVGLFADEQLLVYGPYPAPETKVAFVVPSLSFMFVLAGDTAGEFPSRIKVIAPDKKTVVMDSTPSQGPVSKLAGRPAVFGMAAKPFGGPAFGTYSLQLELGKAKFTFRFSVEKAEAPTSKRS